jgi:DNA-binding protein HU-beta
VPVLSQTEETLNKNDLVSEVASRAGLSRAQAERVVSAFTGAIAEALAKGEAVALVGFGSFLVKARAARSGRNPRTGKAIAIADGRAPAFKPGKALRDAVSGHT